MARRRVSRRTGPPMAHLAANEPLPVADGKLRRSCRTARLSSVAVSNSSPIMCFGIMGNGRRSSYWRLRAGMTKPELFLEREGHGKRWHFSLHASGRWHMKEGRQERLSWTRPPELVPGFTRAVAVIVSPTTIHRADNPAEFTRLVELPKDSDPVSFSIFLEQPGANLDSGRARTR